MKKSTSRPWITTGLLCAAPLAGCGSHEQSCELNPYVCAEGGAGPTTETLECGPCEVDDGDGGCEPVAMVSRGECAADQTCSGDLQCKMDVGRPCGGASDCATGVCALLGDTKCATCAADADCAAEPDRPLCGGGWCRRPAGAPCKTDVACITNRCAAGVCAACESHAHCSSGQCDDDTNRCLSADSEPCTLAADCASGKCDGHCIP